VYNFKILETKCDDCVHKVKIIEELVNEFSDDRALD